MTMKRTTKPPAARSSRTTAKRPRNPSPSIFSPEVEAQAGRTVEALVRDARAKAGTRNLERAARMFAVTTRRALRGEVLFRLASFTGQVEDDYTVRAIEPDDRTAWDIPAAHTFTVETASGRAVLTTRRREEAEVIAATLNGERRRMFATAPELPAAA